MAGAVPGVAGRARAAGPRVRRGAGPHARAQVRAPRARVATCAKPRDSEDYTEAEEEEEDEATAALRDKLMAQYAPAAAAAASAGADEGGAGNADEREPLDGWGLRQLMNDKYGASYEVRIVRRRDPLQPDKFGFYCQVMWKYFEMQSFQMSEAQFMEQMDVVAGFLEEWGVADDVVQQIIATRKRPWCDTVGARAVSIPLKLSKEIEETYAPYF